MLRRLEEGFGTDNRVIPSAARDPVPGVDHRSRAALGMTRRWIEGCLPDNSYRISHAGKNLQVILRIFPGQSCVRQGKCPKGERGKPRSHGLRTADPTGNGQTQKRRPLGRLFAIWIVVTYWITISTRRFCGSRTPSAVCTRRPCSPRPITAIAVAGTPSRTSASLTVFARRSDSAML